MPKTLKPWCLTCTSINNFVFKCQPSFQLSFKCHLSLSIATSSTLFIHLGSRVSWTTVNNIACHWLKKLKLFECKSLPHPHWKDGMPRAILQEPESSFQRGWRPCLSRTATSSRSTREPRWTRPMFENNLCENFPSFFWLTNVTPTYVLVFIFFLFFF